MKSTHWKKIFSAGGLLYLILDTRVIKQARRNIFSLTARLAGEIDLFQLRSGDLYDREYLEIAKRLRRIIRQKKKLFIVNDRAAIARLSGADGLHLGKKDLPVGEARRILGRDKIIGKTTHTLKELSLFQKEEIDYLSIGPVFGTKTKPGLPCLKGRELKKMARKAKKTAFAIGGIKPDNFAFLPAKGIRNIAVSRGIILSPDPKESAKYLKRCLKKVL